MQTTLQCQIADKIAQYVRGEISSLEFEEWFAPVAWSIDETGNEIAQQLVYKTQRLSAEYASGHWSLNEFKSELANLIGLRHIDAEAGQRIEHDHHVG